MSDRLNNAVTKSPGTREVGAWVEGSVFQAIMRRRAWERRWYNNNWFDDGLHFRVMSKRTGQIIDHVQRQSGFVERAIPRASKQIRAIGALLLTPEYYPVVYPERIISDEFMNKVSGQIDQQAYEAAEDKAKREAKLRGIFIQRTWEDELQLELKIADMILLSLKNCISYLQVYTDPHTKRVTGDVLDAFDVIHYGDRRELDELPFITKAQPMDFNEVITNEMFDEERRAEISPDNLYATSEIKEAYMRARMGSKLNAQGLNTVIVKETYMKEYLSDANWEQAKKLGSDTGAMEEKSKGDLIMRHAFSVGGVTLKDEYIDYDNYPFAELRMESGYLYQVPVMERFIPLNKSQDIVATRIEKWINTMVTGIYRVRKGENMIINNLPGGQKVEYEGTAPDQMQITSVGSTPFQFMELTDKYIEEQGISSTNISQLPNNVADNTIENIQQQEYTNMKFANARLKSCVKRVGELIMERGDKDYIHPAEISYEDQEKGKKVIKYFDVVGSRGKKAYNKVNKRLPKDVITLNRKAKIRIEADTGMGLTADGRRKNMIDLITQGLEWFKAGFLSPTAMSMLIKKYVEEMGFGSTEEFMDEIDKGVTQGMMSQSQIQQMKIALLQVMKDTKTAGPEHEKALTDSTKLGTLQTMKDVGLLDQLNSQGKQNIETDDLVKLYDKAPEDVRRAIEAKLGLPPSQSEPIAPSQADSAKKLHEVVKEKHEMTINDAQQELAQRQQAASEDQASQQGDLAQQQQALAEKQATQPQLTSDQ